jgi:tetratricopeptide (TPR) repeat protein
VVSWLVAALAVGLTLPAGGELTDAPCAAKKKMKRTSRRHAKARAAFEKAKALFEADEFEGAVVYFKRAYEYSDRRPSTIIALAQCERILKRYDDALLHLREYLDTGLPEAEAIKVRETIQVVEELDAIEEREIAAAPPVQTATIAAPYVPPPIVLITTPPPVEEEPSLLQDPIFWIVVGSVLVAGGTAAGIAVAATDKDPYAGSRDVLAQPDLR